VVLEELLEVAPLLGLEQPLDGARGELVGANTVSGPGFFSDWT